MPMPNDFRAMGPLGGYFAGLEFADEREKSELAKLMTQAQTGQVNQATDQAQQLLPLLLQQREQENQVRAKSALEAQLGMANVPQEVANQGALAQLTGMQTQDKIASQPEEARIAGQERKGKGLGLEQQNQLKALEQINYILKTQGNLAGATAASELGMNPEVLFKDPTMIGKAIDMLKTQMKDTPTFRQDISKEELKSMTSLEQSRIAAGASMYGADQSRIAREKEAEARATIKANALSMEKQAQQDLAAYRAAEDRGAPQEELDKLRSRAEQSYLATTQIKAAAQQMGVVLDPGTKELIPTRPGGAAPTLPRVPQGSGGNPQAQGSSGARIRYDAQGNRIQ